MKTIKNKMNIVVIVISLTIMILLTFSCSDLYDNIQKFADSETIYAI